MHLRSLYDCMVNMVNIKLKYNSVIAELSVRKLLFLLLLALMKIWAYGLNQNQKLCDDKLTWCFHKIIL